jgi:hypothetical protein
MHWPAIVALLGREGRLDLPGSSDRQSAVWASLARPYLDFLQRHAAALFERRLSCLVRGSVELRLMGDGTEQKAACRISSAFGWRNFRPRQTVGVLIPCKSKEASNG